MILSPLEADNRPASAEALEDLITARLPLVELSELLIEVDAWTHFSDHFVHAAGADTLRPTLQAKARVIYQSVRRLPNLPPGTQNF